jgi:hypothetical protein
MPTITLGELGVRVSPREPFFLNVDVEGADMEVLRGIDWEVFLPGVICIEEHESPLQGPTVVSGYLEERGYTLQAYSIASSIYAHADSVNPPANHGGMGNVNG